MDVLKVFVYNDVDVNFKDIVGFVLVYYVVVNNNCFCLVFLLGLGFVKMEVRDRFGKLLLYVVRDCLICRMWLLLGSYLG